MLNPMDRAFVADQSDLDEVRIAEELSGEELRSAAGNVCVCLLIAASDSSDVGAREEARRILAKLGLNLQPSRRCRPARLRREWFGGPFRGN